MLEVISKNVRPHFVIFPYSCAVIIILEYYLGAFVTSKLGCVSLKKSKIGFLNPK